MPTRDAQWIIGAILAAAVALSVQIAGLRSEHTAIRAEVAELRTDMRRMDDRLRGVEVEFAKVDQRLATRAAAPAHAVQLIAATW